MHRAGRQEIKTDNRVLAAIIEWFSLDRRRNTCIYITRPLPRAVLSKSDLSEIFSAFKILPSGTIGVYTCFTGEVVPCTVFSEERQ